jgi:hypothetical protein
VMAADQDEPRIADAQASQHVVADASAGAADEESGAHVLLPATQRDATDGTHVQREYRARILGGAPRTCQ